jgi:uncharacterized protein YkwD
VQPILTIRWAAPVIVAAVLALVAVSSVDAGGLRIERDLVAPTDVCPGSSDAGASVQNQQTAMFCLVNWARQKVGRPSLQPSRALFRAAIAKARDIDTCDEFAHRPCGRPVFHRVRQHGRRFGALGETLYVADIGSSSPRAAFRAWLGSPSHRELLLKRWFRGAGVAVRPVNDLDGIHGLRLWVLELADRR